MFLKKLHIIYICGIPRRFTVNQTKAELQDDTVNPNLLWEMVKMKVREESLKYGTSKKKKLMKKEEEIEQAIASLKMSF